MTLTEKIITIALVVLGTMLTRFLPFFVFPVGKPTPRYIQYLGKVLPTASMGLLVIYCLRDISFLPGGHGAAACIAVVLVTALHLFKRNMLLSIAGGTAAYMLLIHLF